MLGLIDTTQHTAVTTRGELKGTDKEERGKTPDSETGGTD